MASCWNGPTYTSYKLFHGHWGAISGCLHVSRIRFINGVCPAITRIDSLRPAILFSPCSNLFSSLRAGPSPHAWLISGKTCFSSVPIELMIANPAATHPSPPRSIFTGKAWKHERCRPQIKLRACSGGCIGRLSFRCGESRAIRRRRWKWWLFGRAQRFRSRRSLLK